MKIPITGYWTFFCNPGKFEIDRYWDADTAEDFWHITEGHKDFFQKGQKGVIRVGRDNRTKAKLMHNQRLNPGVYAIVEVKEDACKRIPRSESIKSEYAIDLIILKNLLYNPLLLEVIQDDPIISKDNCLINGRKFQGHPSMPLKKETYERITELINYEDNKIKEIEKAIEKAIEKESVSNPVEINKLENRFINAKPEVKNIVSRRIERGPLAQYIKKINDYRCLICDKLGKEKGAYSFLKKNGKQPYIEAHHVIPVSEQKIGILGLTNIITVCANHHRQLHYGNVKCEIDEARFIFELDDIPYPIVIEKFRLTKNS